MSKRSERKRQEEEARRRQEMMRRQMMMQQQQYGYGYGMQQPMMMNNNMSYGPMNNNMATPCAMPSRFIQLTPIIQPIAMVPYSTQNQPLMMYGNDGMGMGGGFDGYPGEDDFY